MPSGNAETRLSQAFKSKANYALASRALGGEGKQKFRWDRVPVSDEMIELLDAQLVPGRLGTEIAGRLFACDDCTKRKEGALPCTFERPAMSSNSPHAIPFKQCLRCARNVNKAACHIGEVQERARDATMRLFYNSIKPEETQWMTSGQADRFVAKEQNKAAIDFLEEAYQRAVKIESMNRLLGYQYPNPGIYSHDTLNSIEKNAKKKEEEKEEARLMAAVKRQNLLEDEDLDDEAEGIAPLSPARSQSPNAAVNSQEIYPSADNFLSHFTLDDELDLAAQSCLDGNFGHQELPPAPKTAAELHDEYTALLAQHDYNVAAGPVVAKQIEWAAKLRQEQQPAQGQKRGRDDQSGNDGDDEGDQDDDDDDDGSSRRQRRRQHAPSPALSPTPKNSPEPPQESMLDTLFNSIVGLIPARLRGGDGDDATPVPTQFPVSDDSTSSAAGASQLLQPGPTSQSGTAARRLPLKKARGGPAVQR